VTSLIPETLVPLSTRRYPCVADVVTSSGDTSRMSEYVIASYVDEVGDKHEFPLIKWKQSDHIIIGIVDPPLLDTRRLACYHTTVSTKCDLHLSTAR
jgi:hypothetical protein